ncbi:TetR/AcrR family transcriptional regulator [Rhodococcus gannanensis]|uniref:TetR/AcrR family transcriptional regulator n=1 Tax=Rhodococcus gannanensis TaxID=1960308 RepID=A0ABW4NZT1_9NOCA
MTARRTASRGARSAGGSGSGSRSSRLSVDDWIEAAFDLLVREGVTGVKITRLCEDLGVTKGSFYWHFTDIDHLMKAVADRWCAIQNETLLALKETTSIPGDQRLEAMAVQLMSQRGWAVEVAVRDWARTDAQVADSVARLDNQVFDVVQSTLLDLGFDAEEARLRSGVLVYAGVGFLHARGHLPDPTIDEVRQVFALLTSRD